MAFGSVIAAATALLLLWSCPAADAARARPDIVLIVSDDQRPDTIGALGNPHIATPHLDALVRRGTVFRRATCSNPICTPSRAEILTGTSGFRNGVLDFSGRISDDVPRLGRSLQQADYDTVYVGKWHNNGRPADHGYQRVAGLFTGGGGRFAKPQQDYAGRPVTGYRGWVFRTADGEPQPERGTGLTPDISARFADAAVEIIRQASERPLFLHVNFTAPHDPLLIPPGYDDRYHPSAIPLPDNFLPEHPFDHGNFRGRDEQLFAWPRTAEETRRELAAYYAVLTHMDAQIGRIVDALRNTGRLERTVLVFTSDHGLAIGSHGLRGKQNMYEHTIGVPLILAGPGIPRQHRTDAQCCLRDLFPTLLDLAGCPVPQTIDGRSLKPILDGTADRVYDAVFGCFRTHQRMIRTDRWKLIVYPQIDRTQLFDLAADPRELRDLADDPQHAETVRRLRARLRAWQESVKDPVLRTAVE